MAMLLSEVDASAVNLLQGRHALRLPLARWWRQWRAVAVLFAAALCIDLLATYAQYNTLAQDNLELRRAVEQSFRTVVPRGAMTKAEVQLQEKINSLRGAAQTGGFVSLMNRVGAVVASHSGTRIATINYSDRRGEMRMKISAADFEAVEAIRTALNKAGMQAVMENSSTQGDRVRARITVGGGS